MMGIGAFTSASAERSVSVQVASDESAFLAMRPCDGSPSGAYVDSENGSIQLDLTSDNPTSAGGEGVNADATSRFDQVFEIQNQGTQPVGVWLNVDAAMHGGEPRIEFYQEDDLSTGIAGQASTECLNVGESFCIGFIIRTQGLSSGATEDALFASTPGSHGEEMVVNADAEVRCGSGGGGGTIPGPTNGLAHYWPLDSVGDDTAEDIVGGSDGTVSGASSITGQVNGSSGALFDGDDDVITASGAYASSPITVSAWFRVDGSGGKNPRVVGTDDNSFRLYVENDYSLPFDIDDGPRTDSPNPVDEGEWYHGVGTYDGSTARLYLDGHEVDWTSASISPAATGVFIGERVSGLDPLNGAINDVRIYDRALSAEEVTALYNATNLPLGTTSAPDGRERGVRRGRARPLPTLVHDGSIPSVGFA